MKKKKQSSFWKRVGVDVGDGVSFLTKKAEADDEEDDERSLSCVRVEPST